MPIQKSLETYWKHHVTPSRLYLLRQVVMVAPSCYYVLFRYSHLWSFLGSVLFMEIWCYVGIMLFWIEFSTHNSINFLSEMASFQCNIIWTQTTLYVAITVSAVLKIISKANPLSAPVQTIIVTDYTPSLPSF